MKVLLSAYACEPDKGSEPEVGWCWARYLADYCNVTVITRENNRQKILCGLQKMSKYKTTANPSFIYYDLPQFFLILKRLRILPATFYYILWLVAVTWKFRKKSLSYDIVHHITFNAFQIPGFWWNRHPCIVLGPLGGGQMTSWAYLSLFGFGAPMEFLRSCFVKLTRFNPLILPSYFNARCILVANKDTLHNLPHSAFCKVRLMLETGISSLRIKYSESQSSSPYVIWVGRMEKRKAGLLAVRSFSRAIAMGASFKLLMIGDGPEKNRIKIECARLGISNSVSFLGRLPLSEVDKYMSAASVLLFTSVRDTSGNVVLEAMAAGKPIVAIRHQGVAEIADDSCCLFIEPGSIGQTEQCIANVIYRLESDKDLRSRMGAAAVERIKNNFIWESKAKEMISIYRENLRSIQK